MILPRPCNLGLPHVSEMAGLSSHVVPADMRCAARLTIRVAPPMSCPSICLPRVEKPACLAHLSQPRRAPRSSARSSGHDAHAGGAVPPPPAQKVLPERRRLWPPFHIKGNADLFRLAALLY